MSTSHVLTERGFQGFDEMEVRVDVLAPPSVPKGFLEISGVTPTSCKLNWKKPEDDGGSPILGYVIEKNDVDRNIWVACGKVSGKTMAVMKVKAANWLLRACEHPSLFSRLSSLRSQDSSTPSSTCSG